VSTTRSLPLQYLVYYVFVATTAESVFTATPTRPSASNRGLLEQVAMLTRSVSPTTACPTRSAVSVPRIRATSQPGFILSLGQVYLEVSDGHFTFFYSHNTHNVILGMIITMVILFFVHRRQRDDEREKRLQYWREQVKKIFFFLSHRRAP